MTDKELQEIARLQKESSGYMEIVPNHYTPNRNKIRMGDQEIWIGTGPIEQTAIDYEYITKACNSVPEMIKEIKHLRKMVDFLVKKLEKQEVLFLNETTGKFREYKTQDWLEYAKEAANEA